SGGPANVAKVTMPQLGESVAEGTIGKWLKQPGDHVDKYEPLVEVITDKVNAEVPSPFAGILREILVEEGATVPNNAEIAVIETAEDGAQAAGSPQPAPSEAKTAPAAAPAPSPAAAPATPEPPKPLPAPTQPAPAAAAAVPAASGPAPPATAAAASAPSARGISGQQVTFPEGADEVLVPMTQMRRGIANQLTRALQVPHAYVQVEVDASRLVRLRETNERDFQAREGTSLSFVPFVVKAVVNALKRNPAFNAHLTDQGL